VFLFQVLYILIEQKSKKNDLREVCSLMTVEKQVGFTYLSWVPQILQCKNLSYLASVLVYIMFYLFTVGGDTLGIGN
jgi:hypothetical protein